MAKSIDAPVPFILWKHLNKLRWVTLVLVLLLLILLPFISQYQSFVAAHAYDLLDPSEKRIYDIIEWLTKPFVTPPHAHELDLIKGNTWSGTLFGVKLSDPLAVLGQVAATLQIYWPLLMTLLIPVIATVVLGRFYCGWICPATLLYELNDILLRVLRRSGVRLGGRHWDLRIKYLVLVVGAGLSVSMGTVVFSAIYPPAIVGREIQYWITWNGLGTGSAFFVITLLFDLLVTRRGFCRYLCPGGALYSLLGRFRLVRIQRLPPRCNDCTLCNKECQFALDPMRDGFGQECNNCSACIAVCPTRALTFRLTFKDQPYQGHGHLSPTYRRQHDHREDTVETLGKTDGGAV